MIQSFGFRVWSEGLRFRVLGLGLRVDRVEGLGFRVDSRVKGFGVCVDSRVMGGGVQG